MCGCALDKVQMASVWSETAQIEETLAAPAGANFAAPTGERTYTPAWTLHGILRFY